MKTYNKKFNAKRAADGLAKRFPGYTAADPVDMGGGEWMPNVIAPKATIAEGVPEELAEAAYVNGERYAPDGAPAVAPTKPLRARIEEAPAARNATKPAAKAEHGSKRAIVADLLLRKDGVTAKEILAATGWKALNIPGTAKSLGIKLRQVKEGRTTTYYGTR